MLRTPAGVEEHIALALGYGTDEAPPLERIRDLAAEFDTRHGLVTLLTAVRAARRDLTVPPHLEHPPIPVAFTLGHDERRRIGPDRAERPPQGPTPVQLGSALHSPLGDGTDPHAWSVFQRLTHHLKQAPTERES
ncbi:DUF6177 family protein [Streptomyces sp. DH24]|uniref:DUF6177 family protein n=1 Tax=Streptomyces sp. DH24 TaxID=3040123 RepID=UPI002441DA39|nr:DUF6177 family protein [Streptomyces sp. DH24]MDG9716037.1 DUF6177 family protein [Streptomyces sp. DH24]